VKRAQSREAKPIRVCLARSEFGPAYTLARATQLIFRGHALRVRCARPGGAPVRYRTAFGATMSHPSSDRSTAYESVALPNYHTPNPSASLACSFRPRLVPTRGITTRVPSRVKKRTSPPESTPLPASSGESPLYLLYFGVSIWAALVGYGAHFYLSSSQDDSGPRTSLSGPSRKDSISDLQNAISDLHLAFPGADRVLTDAEVLKTYGLPKYTMYTGSEDVHPHGVVVFPLSTEDVVAVVNIAKKWRVPIVPFGSGTSLEGHTCGVSGAVRLSDKDSPNQLTLER